MSYLGRNTRIYLFTLPFKIAFKQNVRMWIFISQYQYKSHEIEVLYFKDPVHGWYKTFP